MYQPEYLEAKAKWEETLGKLEELTTHTTELVRAREVVYDQLVGASLSTYAASEQAAASSARYVLRVCIYVRDILHPSDFSPFLRKLSFSTPGLPYYLGTLLLPTSHPWSGK